MKYPLILADFDNTLHCDEKKISPTAADVIKRYQNSGGHFAICTGRVLPSILPYAKQMGLTGDLVVSQGSVIYDLDNDKTILAGGIAADLAAQLLDYIEQKYTHINIYKDGLVYVNRYDEVTKAYEEYVGIKTHLLNMPPSQFMRKNGGYAEKLLVFNKSEDNDACLIDLTNKFGSNAVVSTSGPVFVEIADVGYSKGKALEYLANKYNVDMQNTIAIGDSLNDMTMILAAGKGIAVANACEELKRAADEITVSCSERAVEKVILKYGLGESI